MEETWRSQLLEGFMMLKAGAVDFEFTERGRQQLRDKNYLSSFESVLKGRPYTKLKDTIPYFTEFSTK